MQKQSYDAYMQKAPPATQRAFRGAEYEKPMLYPVYCEFSKTHRCPTDHPARDFDTEEGWRTKLYRKYYEFSKIHRCPADHPARDFAVEEG